MAALWSLGQIFKYQYTLIVFAWSSCNPYWPTCRSGEASESFWKYINILGVKTIPKKEWKISSYTIKFRDGNNHIWSWWAMFFVLKSRTFQFCRAMFCFKNQNFSITLFLFYVEKECNVFIEHYIDLIYLQGHRYFLLALAFIKLTW